MNEDSSFQNNQICFGWFKKKKNLILILIFQNTKSVLYYLVLGDNSNMCLLHKIKSFDLKNIRSIF